MKAKNFLFSGKKRERRGEPIVTLLSKRDPERGKAWKINLSLESVIETNFPRDKAKQMRTHRVKTNYPSV